MEPFDDAKIDLRKHRTAKNHLDPHRHPHCIDYRDVTSLKLHTQFQKYIMCICPNSSNKKNKHEFWEWSPRNSQQLFCEDLIVGPGVFLFVGFKGCGVAFWIAGGLIFCLWIWWAFFLYR